MDAKDKDFEKSGNVNVFDLSNDIDTTVSTENEMKKVMEEAQKTETDKKDSKKSKKKFFSKDSKEKKQYEEKIASLENDIEEKDKKIKELDNSYQRMLAENRNQKSRLEKDFQTRVKYSSENFFKEFILIKDEFEKALSYIPENYTDETILPFIDGIKLLDNKIDTLMKRFGVESYSSVDTEFDPNLHQAIKMVDSDKSLNTVVTEYVKGYSFLERTLRPAMVEVSNGNAKQEEAPVTNENAKQEEVQIEDLKENKDPETNVENNEA